MKQDAELEKQKLTDSLTLNNESWVDLEEKAKVIAGERQQLAEKLSTTQHNLSDAEEDLTRVIYFPIHVLGFPDSRILELKILELKTLVLELKICLSFQVMDLHFIDLSMFFKYN